MKKTLTIAGHEFDDFEVISVRAAEGQMWLWPDTSIFDLTRANELLRPLDDAPEPFRVVTPAGYRYDCKVHKFGLPWGGPLGELTAMVLDVVAELGPES